MMPHRPHWADRRNSSETHRVAAKKSEAPNKSFKLDLSSRGYQVLFWRDQVNHCPGCGRSQWHIGRITAECGLCGTALPIDGATQVGFELTGHKAVALHVIEGGKQAAEVNEQRSEERAPAEGRTIALYIDGTSHAFALQNISAGGLKGEALPGIGEASTLIVELENGIRIPAELKWCDGDFAGLAFVKKSRRQ